MYAIYAAENGLEPRLPVGWIGLILITVIMFGYLAQSHRSRWKHPKFFMTIAIFLALHALAWLPIVATFEDRALPFLVIGMTPEYVVMNSVLGAILRRHSGDPSPKA